MDGGYLSAKTIIPRKYLILYTFLFAARHLYIVFETDRTIYLSHHVRVVQLEKYHILSESR